jgi:hypothetical protein
MIPSPKGINSQYIEEKPDENAYSVTHSGWNFRIRHFIFLRRWNYT